MILGRVGDVYTCLVRRLEGGEREGRCDQCIRRHSFARVSCGMNHAAPRAYAPCLYDFKTRAPVPGRWASTVVTWQNSNVGIEEWRRLAPTANTPTRGLIVSEEGDV